jgi:MraZ protein
VLRGNSPAKIDDKGRLKVPNAFRVAIQEAHGRELFVTSLEGDTHPARKKFLSRMNFNGQVTEFDPQGRVLIQPRLREQALMVGEVDVLGQQNFLEVWNHDRLLAQLAANPFTDEDAKALSEFGI